MMWLKNFLVSTLACISLTPVSGQYNGWDVDQDLLPDAWEEYHGLNPNYLKDAWTDLDQDGVPNIYEYYLGSDPSDPTQPIIFNYDAPTEQLLEFLQQIPRGSLVRLKAEVYKLNLEFPISNQPIRILLEGGWNEDFSYRNTCEQTTLFDGGGKGSIISVNVPIGNSTSLLVDGISFTNSWGPAIQMVGYVDKMQLAINDCTFYQNQLNSGKGVISFQDGPYTLLSDFLMANNALVDNQGTVLSTKQSGMRSNCVLMHNSIFNNRPANFDEYGLYTGFGWLHKSESLIYNRTICYQNVFWDNHLNDIIIDKNDVSQVALEYNLLETIIINDSVPILPPSNLYQNPDYFWNNESLGLYLDSPCRIELPSIRGYTQNLTTGIGRGHCFEIRSTTATYSNPRQTEITIYPNPVQSTLYINQKNPISYTIQIFDIQGRVCRRQTINGAKRVALNVNDLSKGWHMISFYEGGKLIESMPFIKK